MSEMANAAEAIARDPSAKLEDKRLAVAIMHQQAAAGYLTQEQYQLYRQMQAALQRTHVPR